MNVETTDEEPVVRAYQALVAMPAVGLRAGDWIVYRSAAVATFGDLIFAKFRGDVVTGRLLRGASGEHLFFDSRRGEYHPIAKSNELQILGIVLAVRGEYALH